MASAADLFPWLAPAANPGKSFGEGAAAGATVSAAWQRKRAQQLDEKQFEQRQREYDDLLPIRQQRAALEQQQFEQRKSEFDQMLPLRIEQEKTMKAFRDAQVQGQILKNQEAQRSIADELENQRSMGQLNSYISRATKGGILGEPGTEAFVWDFAAKHPTVVKDPSYQNILKQVQVAKLADRNSQAKQEQEDQAASIAGMTQAARTERTQITADQRAATAVNTQALKNQAAIAKLTAESVNRESPLSKARRELLHGRIQLIERDSLAKPDEKAAAIEQVAKDFGLSGKLSVDYDPTNAPPAAPIPGPVTAAPSTNQWIYTPGGIKPAK